MGLCVCVSLKSHLTYGESVYPENALTYSVGNEGQKICGNLPERTYMHMPQILRDCRSVVFVGALVFPIPLVFKMVFVKEVFSLLYFLPYYTWMVCWLILLSVVLVIIGIIYLLVVCVMLITFFYLHPALLR